MKSIILSLAAASSAIAITACETLSSGSSIIEEPESPSIFVSATDGPDIVLFKDGSRILTLGTGDDVEVSKDPDMHHIAGGCLYTEFTTATETVIKKNGEELFRYSGREILKGILVKDEALYTLGQDKDGQGFSFRKDGEILLSNTEGRVWGDMYEASYSPSGALYEDQGDICFIYCTGNGRHVSWYAVREGKEKAFTPPDAVSDIYDIRRYDGDVCLVAMESHYRGPVLYIGGRRTDLSTSSSVKCGTYRIHSNDSDFYISGCISDPGKAITYLWKAASGSMKAYEGNCPVFMMDGNGTACISYCRKEIRYSSDNLGAGSLSGTFKKPSGRTCLFADGVLYIAANPYGTDKSPILWKDGTEQSFEVDGVLTGISLY